MDDALIGVAELKYDEDGNIIASSFIPEAIKETVVDNPPKTGNVAIVQHARKVAKSIISKYFNNVSNFELADREHFEIAEKSIIAKRYPDKKIKQLSIQFELKKVN